MKEFVNVIVSCIIGMTAGLYICNSVKTSDYEAGKRFVRDSLLQSTDKQLLNNYDLTKPYTGIPDSILNRQISELSDSGSYKIKGKGLR